MKVLVIDDEAGIRAVFEEFLGMLGHEVDLAADGAAGLARLEHGHYDLVITDIVMPGMSGLAIAQALRERQPGVRVLVISGSADRFDMEKLRHAGFDYLQKPVMFEQFQQAVKGHAAAPSLTGTPGHEGKPG